VLFEEEVKAVIELASFSRFSETHQAFLDQLTESIGIVLNTIAATCARRLLKQSQLLTTEAAEPAGRAQEDQRAPGSSSRDAAPLRGALRTQQDKLRRPTRSSRRRRSLLEVQKREVETKNREVSVAKTALEEKAEQLQLTSRYKSQFLANMSHELRTPLNSLLILSKLLSDNPDGNLSDKQREFAKTIHAAGADLLSLINDILDLSKIESGTVTIEAGDVGFQELAEHAERTFRHEAEARRLNFKVTIDPRLPCGHAHRCQEAAAGAAQPPVERLQVHRNRQRCADDRPRRWLAFARRESVGVVLCL
jgi:signal transduction histidine kinase